MRRSRITWAVLALAAGSSGAGAMKLDKSACNLLHAELAGIAATGTRDDMERGPAWAKANLSPARLRKIQRLIEIEEQLEFRCGMRRKRIVAIEAHAPKGPKGKIVVPEGPVKKPAVKSNALKPSRQDAKKSAPRKAAAASTATTSSGKPAAAPPVPEAVATASPQPQAPASPTKTSRRRGSTAYVPPSQVNPFFVTRYGDRR